MLLAQSQSPADDGGHDSTRANAVGADIKRTEFHGNTLYHLYDGRFTGAVCMTAKSGAMSSSTGCVDDVTGHLLFHHRCPVFHPQCADFSFKAGRLIKDFFIIP